MYSDVRRCFRFCNIWINRLKYLLTSEKVEEKSVNSYENPELIDIKSAFKAKSLDYEGNENNGVTERLYLTEANTKKVEGSDGLNLEMIKHVTEVSAKIIYIGKRA